MLRQILFGSVIYSVWKIDKLVEVIAVLIDPLFGTVFYLYSCDP